MQQMVQLKRKPNRILLKQPKRKKLYFIKQPNNTTQNATPGLVIENFHQTETLTSTNNHDSNIQQALQIQRRIRNT